MQNISKIWVQACGCQDNFFSSCFQKIQLVAVTVEEQIFTQFFWRYPLQALYRFINQLRHSTCSYDRWKYVKRVAVLICAYFWETFCKGILFKHSLAAGEADGGGKRVWSWKTSQKFLNPQLDLEFITFASWILPPLMFSWGSVNMEVICWSIVAFDMYMYCELFKYILGNHHWRSSKKTQIIR